MNLHRQPRKEYKVFNITEESQNDRILLLQLNSDNFRVTEDTFDESDAKDMFLTETLGQKEDLNKKEAQTSDADMNDVTKLAEDMFLTKHLGWHKGLKLFGEISQKAIQKELQQIHDTEGFQSKYWYKLTKNERGKALKYLMYL